MLKFLLKYGFVFFKHKTAYEVRISDWSSDVCSSDLVGDTMPPVDRQPLGRAFQPLLGRDHVARREPILAPPVPPQRHQLGRGSHRAHHLVELILAVAVPERELRQVAPGERRLLAGRSEERGVGHEWVRTGRYR